MYQQYESGYEAFKPEKFEYAFEDEAEIYGEAESPFTEAEEMELALEMLEISSEAELDQFLGSLVSKAWGGIKKIGAKALPAVGGILKSVAKKALPMVGGALGSFIPIPGVGTALGTALGTAASNLFEGELEGLSQEEQEFEIARRFVRFGGATVRRAGRFPRSVSPYSAARRAAFVAARRFVPGLYRRRPSGLRGGQPISRRYAPGYRIAPSRVNGRWIRRGPTVVLPNYYPPPVTTAAWLEPSAEPPSWPEPSAEPSSDEPSSTQQADGGDEGTE